MSGVIVLVVVTLWLAWRDMGNSASNRGFGAGPSIDGRSVLDADATRMLASAQVTPIMTDTSKYLAM
jgi:hypothetical protein